MVIKKASNYTSPSFPQEGQKNTSWKMLVQPNVSSKFVTD